MPTEASLRALENIRDLSMLKWYVIPLLAITFYIYTSEIKKARSSGNWDAVFAGLTVFGMNFINETWNGWVFYLTQHSAFWTTPGETALRTMVGWNIEIIFMFMISGFIYYYSLSPNKADKILGIPNRWFWAIGYAAFCVFVECLLYAGGLADRIQPRRRSMLPHRGGTDDRAAGGGVLETLLDKVDELIVCSSFSKNFGLYCERAGAITLVAKSAEAADAAFSQLKILVRRNYSNPPSHGGAAVAAAPVAPAAPGPTATSLPNRSRSRGCARPAPRAPTSW